MLIHKPCGEESLDMDGAVCGQDGRGRTRMDVFSACPGNIKRFLVRYKRQKLTQHSAALFKRRAPNLIATGTLFEQLLMVIALLLGLHVDAAECERPSVYQDFVNTSYPAEISFDVYRNNKRVGEHITRFAVHENALSVQSRMLLSIKILFLTAYEFEYQSKAVWCGDGLQSLEAITNRNGETTRVKAVAEKNALKVFAPDGNDLAATDIMTTDHWNPRVIDSRRVLNTITGRINEVTIQACERGTPAIERASPGATCYEYRGELQTRVWYDEAGRWRGLEFKGDDGSTISYVCRRCT